ncbi:glucose-1-phosphate thymidylyltransferase [Nonomuraea sp. NPDC049158]|uniref:glucose-1-phosphate thymidylyltransferase n=1 Tax=Nonomuraea sp. NPDC049158 TaxID=3155649 RepID=UPI0033E03226
MGRAEDLAGGAGGGGMKAVVLAGGRGTRLRPLSHTMPKQLVPVAGVPVLFHCLRNIGAAGITETAVVVGSHAERIRSAVGDGAAFGLEVTYLRQEAPLGLAHGVAIARDFLGDDDFVLYLGDNMLAGGIADLAAEFADGRPDALIAVAKVDNPSDYGTAEVRPDGRVTGVFEKDRRSRFDLAMLGVYFFTPAVHEAIGSVPASERGEHEITDAIQWLIEQGAHVRASAYRAYWKDTGRLDDLLACNSELLDRAEGSIEGLVDEDSELHGAVTVAPGARVIRSRITGPVHIGPNALVRDSDITSSTSIGADCVVHRSEVGYSILLDGAHLSGVRAVHGSIIGGGTRVIRTSGKHRLIVGDDCIIHLGDE